MEIDFAVLVPDQDTGRAFGAVVEPMGFKTNVYEDPPGEWTCNCCCTMVPSYDAILAVQQTLEEIGKAYSARPDGWGSFGNAGKDKMQ
jgi:hypothetical protein